MAVGVIEYISVAAVDFFVAGSSSLLEEEQLLPLLPRRLSAHSLPEFVSGSSYE